MDIHLISPSLTKEQIITLKEALSPNCINILMGDFNFVEDALGRNLKLPNALEKDRYLFSEWKNLNDDYDLVIVSGSSIH